MEQQQRAAQVLTAAEALGLAGITPIVLSDGANLIVHLCPYPIIARVAKLFSGNDAKSVLRRELNAARHLQVKQVPVVSPSEAYAGPHKVGATWMTCWAYVPAVPWQPPAPAQAIDLVQILSKALKGYRESLPALGVWERARGMVESLKGHDDPRVESALKAFFKADRKLRALRPESLIPAHGDAHARNLLPTRDGWLWMDFEDVSLMPPYWDLASYVGNLALFGGIGEPTLQYILNDPEIVSDRGAFGFALSARTLMSTLSNLAWALDGDGDLSFAHRQLELCGDFLFEIEHKITG